MRIPLDRSQIDLAIVLGTQTLARYVAAYGEYNNTFNSHTKGRFGELALEVLFSSRDRQIVSHFRNPASDRLCDIEVSPARFRRLEVKTWTESHWEGLGRCISVKQSACLSRKADAVIWCSVPLPRLNGPPDLDSYQVLHVTLLGYSIPTDVLSAPVRWTGEHGMRKVQNHQVDLELIRPIGQILE